MCLSSNSAKVRFLGLAQSSEGLAERTVQVALEHPSNLPDSRAIAYGETVSERARQDAELLAAWREGDRRAGSELFSRYFDDLYGFFHNKVGTPHEAQDLVQQTMLTCVRNRDSFRGDSSFRTFLFTIARSRLIDRHRQLARVGEFASVTSLRDPGQSLSTWFRRREREHKLLDALAGLSLEHRLALELHYVQGFHGSELATVLGLPEGTVRSRLRRAKAALLDRLGSEPDPTLR
jgi:RNA polymerase sigma factor (sigma-70 family)